MRLGRYRQRNNRLTFKFKNQYMNINILDAIIIAGITLFGYVFIKTLLKK
jgi:hypothetical protein